MKTLLGTSVALPSAQFLAALACWLCLCSRLAGQQQAAELSEAPLIGVWQQRSTPDLRGRSSSTAVWTGRELIVFGGEGMGVSFDDGARYDLAMNSWELLPAEGAPFSRTGHTAVWTGREMIVWGGFGGVWGNDTNHNDGARYSPARNTWQPVSTRNAPVARFDHTAVWTGREMLVWGGYTDSHARYAGGHADAHLMSGGRYDPVTDSWRPITTRGAPSRRCWHSAVWTGEEMIIWGGGEAQEALNDGGRYDPATDSWKPINRNCPLSPRVHHVAVWIGMRDPTGCSGEEMIVWGGSTREGDRSSDYFRDGARYSPATDTWTPISMTGGPKGRILTRAFWTGTEMIFWGGVNDAQAGGVYDRGRFVGSGGRYNPATDTWSQIAIHGAPTPRLTSAVWTGQGLLTFGGYNGTHLNDIYYYSPLATP